MRRLTWASHRHRNSTSIRRRISTSNVDVFRMVPSTSVLRREIDVEVRPLSDDPCELCDIAGRPRDVYETSNFDVECRLIRDGPIDVGVLTGY